MIVNGKLITPICSYNFNDACGYDNVEEDLHYVNDSFVLNIFMWDFSWRENNRKMVYEKRQVKLNSVDARTFFDRHYTGDKSVYDNLFNNSNN